MGQLKKILREQILAEMTYERQMSDEEIADLIDRKMDACLEEQPGEFPLTLGERLKLHRELFDSFRRLDILQELVDDPRVTEIMVNGPDQVFVETGGKIGRWEKSFESREQLEDLIQQSVSSVNRIVNTSMPLADARLSDGSRVHVVLEPIALNGPILTIRKFPEFRIRREDMCMKWQTVKEIAVYSSLTCAQQSVMNFGILMVQGLINSFGVAVMAAFAAAVKIDSFAYMPVQDFGNAFSTFIAQNFGAGQMKRIRDGIRVAVVSATIFCVFISLLVFGFARPLMLIFVPVHETEIISIGVQYLRIEGAFYCGIGCLFLLYGFYRGIRKPGMSVVLTVISLGTRVALAYALSAIPAIGVVGIWWSIPIGWLLADIVGLWYYRRLFSRVTRSSIGK